VLIVDGKHIYDALKGFQVRQRKFEHSVSDGDSATTGGDRRIFSFINRSRSNTPSNSSAPLTIQESIVSGGGGHVKEGVLMELNMLSPSHQKDDDDDDKSDNDSDVDSDGDDDFDTRRSGTRGMSFLGKAEQLSTRLFNSFTDQSEHSRKDGTKRSVRSSSNNSNTSKNNNNNKSTNKNKNEKQNQKHRRRSSLDSAIFEGRRSQELHALVSPTNASMMMAKKEKISGLSARAASSLFPTKPGGGGATDNVGHHHHHPSTIPLEFLQQFDSNDDSVQGDGDQGSNATATSQQTSNTGSGSDSDFAQHQSKTWIVNVMDKVKFQMRQLFKADIEKVSGRGYHLFYMYSCLFRYLLLFFFLSFSYYTYVCSLSLSPSGLSNIGFEFWYG
jgi:hypothetical protein